MFNALRVLAALLVISGPADAEIFKCVNEKGLTVYQNFLCQFDSKGSLLTAPAPQQAPGLRAVSPEASGGRLRAAASSVRTASMAADGRVQPRIGMTRGEVRRLSWGRPSRISRDRETEAEIWTYDANRVVWFDRTGHVSAIQG